jgi:hypothetical protein
MLRALRPLMRELLMLLPTLCSQAFSYHGSHFKLPPRILHHHVVHFRHTVREALLIEIQ